MKHHKFDGVKNKNFLTEEEILEEYKQKIFTNNFKLYEGFPLNEEDYRKCKIWENNIDFLKQVVIENCEKNLGYDINDFFGVGDRTTLRDIPEHIALRKRQQEYPFPFDDEFRKKLLFSPKFKLYETTKMGVVAGFGKPSEYESLAKFYATEITHNNKTQIVVIKITINYLNPNGGGLKAPYDYSGVNVQALIGKKCKKPLFLARLDYNSREVGHPHQNFLDENGNTLDFGESVWKCYRISGSHLHLPSQKFELLNPHGLGSGDAIRINTNGKSFLQLAEEFLKNLNICEISNAHIPMETKVHEAYKILKAYYEKEINKSEINIK